MPRTEFIKLNQDYQSDYNFTSVAISSSLLEYRVCIELRTQLNLKLHKIEDLQIENNSGNLVTFPFYISDENVSGISIYLIPNTGAELNSNNAKAELSLFEDSSPRIFNLFGAKLNSIFAIKDVRPDYYLIIKHPQKEIDKEKWKNSLKSIENIQPISVQSSEYVKHHNSLMTDIELHIGEYESILKRDIKRRRELLKKKMNDVKNSFGIRA